ncbi:MAG: hypothetical protein ACRYFY_00930, partial [Janthinobacterium lividum]
MYRFDGNETCRAAPYHLVGNERTRRHPLSFRLQKYPATVEQGIGSSYPSHLDHRLHFSGKVCGEPSCREPGAPGKAQQRPEAVRRR